MKYGYISNQVLYPLLEDRNIYPQVLPVFLECCEKQYIPTILSTKHSYSLKMSEVMKVFTPMVLENITRENNISRLLRTPGLEDFYTLLCILRNEPYVKPD